MKILDGELQETQYQWPSSAETDSIQVIGDITEVSASLPSTKHGQPLVVSKNTVYHPNQVTYVHGKEPIKCNN
jgi:cysteine dioxygenase